MTRRTAADAEALSKKNRAAWTGKQSPAATLSAIVKAGVLVPVRKPSKMRNKKVQTAQGAFSSVREWRRYGELLLMEKAGEIYDLDRQKTFSLDVKSVHICDYRADFVYYLSGTRGTHVVEDVKPNFKTEASRKRYQATGPYRMFLMKKRLMLAVHGIDVAEV